MCFSITFSLRSWLSFFVIEPIRCSLFVAVRITCFFFSMELWRFRLHSSKDTLLAPCCETFPGPSCGWPALVPGELEISFDRTSSKV